MFGKNGIFAAQKDGKYGYVDTKNSVLVPFEYDDISNYVNNVGYGIKDGELYLIKFGSGPSVETPSSWAVEQVSAAIAANLVPENLQSKYTQATTRAEFASLAVTLYETVTGNAIETGNNPFTDTSDINAIKAAAIGVTTGTTETTFSPDANLTREQAATMLSRLANAMEKPLPQQVSTFNDNASIATYAFEAVGQMQVTEIMGGVGDNTFSPKSPYTREQSIMTIWRLFEIVE